MGRGECTRPHDDGTDSVFDNDLIAVLWGDCALVRLAA